MAENLARTLCTEEDKVNCPFYFKNGACRYGDHCIRRHLKPTKTVTLLFPHMYQNSPKEIAISEGNPVPPADIKEALQKFEDFYQEVFLELATFGEIEEMHVCDNIVNHLIGNVLVKFVSEDDAENCKKHITGRSYMDRLVVPEYSPVTDFREGRCRQFETGACHRGGNCNFMHMKIVSKDLLKACYKQMYKDNPQYKERKRKEKETAQSRHRDSVSRSSSDSRRNKRRRTSWSSEGSDRGSTSRRREERSHRRSYRDERRHSLYKDEERDQRANRREERPRNRNARSDRRERSETRKSDRNEYDKVKRLKTEFGTDISYKSEAITTQTHNRDIKREPRSLCEAALDMKEEPNATQKERKLYPIPELEESPERLSELINPKTEPLND